MRLKYPYFCLDKIKAMNDLSSEKQRLAFADFVKKELDKSISQIYECAVENDSEKAADHLKAVKLQIRDLENTFKKEEV